MPELSYSVKRPPTKASLQCRLASAQCARTCGGSPPAAAACCWPDETQAAAGGRCTGAPARSTWSHRSAGQRKQRMLGSAAWWCLGQASAPAWTGHACLWVSEHRTERPMHRGCSARRSSGADNNVVGGVARRKPAWQSRVSKVQARSADIAHSTGCTLGLWQVHTWGALHTWVA